MINLKIILVVTLLVFLPDAACAQTDPSNFTNIINLPSISDGNSFNGTIDSETQLNISEGGSLSGEAGKDDGSSSNVEVNVFGGLVHTNYRAWSGSTINLLGGTFGGGLFVHDGSRLVVSGGNLDGNIRGQMGSIIEVSGGTVGNNSTTEGIANVSGGNVSLAATNGGIVNVSGGVWSGVAFDGGIANMTGGILQRESEVGPGGVLNLHGGIVRNEFSVRGGQLNIHGADFRLNGSLVGGLDTLGNQVMFGLGENDLLSGTLSDGVPIVISRWNSSQFGTTPITLISADTTSIGPSLINASIDPVPNGIRQGQTLVVDQGVTLQNDLELGWGSKLIIESGGTVVQPFGQRMDAVNSTINVNGGTSSSMDIHTGSTLTINPGSVVGSIIADRSSMVRLLGGVASFVDVADGSILDVLGGVVGGINAQRNSTVNFAGGESTRRIFVERDSRLNFSGGSISEVRAFSRSFSNISGGTIREEVFAASGSVLDISGGNFLGNFLANSGSQVNLKGTQFILDGTDISGLLTLEVPFVLTERDVNLIAILEDGSRFDYYLSSIRNRENPNQFSPDSTLTLTLVESVPEPSGILLSMLGMFLISANSRRC